MSTTGAVTHARRVRSQRTVEDKLDEMSKAIEELARAINDIDTRVKNMENLANYSAARR